MIDSSVLADPMMNPRQMRLIKNMDTDSMGFLTGRKGYTQLGDVVVSGKTGLGLHHHIGTNSQIVAFSNDAGDTAAESYYLSGGTWTNKALGFTAGKKIRTVTFLDLLMAVNDTDSPKSWTGAAGDAWGTTSLVSAPTGSLIETYKQQVYIGNTTTDQVNFSSVPSAGAVTWAAADNFIANPNDGSNLTGLKRYAQQLLVFKEDYVYRFNGRSLDPDPVIFYGASSQEAILVAGSVCWFYDGKRNALLAYVGGYPNTVSKPIRPFLEAVPTSSHGDVKLRGDNDHVEAFIGDVTVGSLPFVNVSCRYVISTQTWVVRSYADSFSIFTDYDDGSTVFNLGFDNTGEVQKMDTGNTDDGAAIEYDVETAWLVLGGNPTNEFTLAAFSAFADFPQGLNVFFKTERDSTWRTIGAMRQYMTSWSGINESFHKIKFRFTGITSASQTIFEGYCLTVPLLEGMEIDTLRVQ